MELRRLYLADHLHRIGRIGDKKDPLISHIQEKLQEYGLYTGEIHGVLDTPTQEALLDFQYQQNLPTTGKLDPITFCHLNPYTATKIILSTAKPRASYTLAKPNILITKSNRQLTVFNGNTPLRQFPVALGKPSTPTPVGNFAIATKILNPGGVLGTRWMGLNHDMYGIHGTNSPWLIGQLVSHGCIRMYNTNAEELFALINIGTPVLIRD